jgi:hypothetical protein
MALQNPTAWEYMRPILAENNGVAVFISTPRGKQHFWELYRTGQQANNWFCEKLSVDDTHAISEQAIAVERSSGMSEEMIQQEFYCSFEIGQLGSYYGKCMAEMEKENRIGYVPYDKNLLVYTAWDLGYTDAMSIIFFQRRGNELLIIDHYENHGYAIAHYLDVLRTKGYSYGKHFAPHDGKMHNATGTTFVQVAREAGFDFTVIPNKISVLEGIEKVRGIFPRLFIDREKCAHLIKCLLEYHAEWDDHSKVFRGRPDHSWASHACDGIRYMCLAQEFMGSPSGGLSKEQLQEMRRKHGNY